MSCIHTRNKKNVQVVCGKITIDGSSYCTLHFKKHLKGGDLKGGDLKGGDLKGVGEEGKHSKGVKKSVNKDYNNNELNHESNNESNHELNKETNPELDIELDIELNKELKNDSQNKKKENNDSDDDNDSDYGEDKEQEEEQEGEEKGDLKGGDCDSKSLKLNLLAEIDTEPKKIKHIKRDNSYYASLAEKHISDHPDQYVKVYKRDIKTKELLPEFSYVYVGDTKGPMVSKIKPVDIEGYKRKNDCIYQPTFKKIPKTTIDNFAFDNKKHLFDTTARTPTMIEKKYH